MNFTRRDQSFLLDAALGPTQSVAWRDDARAFGGYHANGDLAVVVVFQDFCGTEAEMHLAALNGHQLSRPAIEAFKRLAFDAKYFGLTRVWISIAEDNPRAQAAALRAGFEFEYRKRSGFLGHKDAIVMSMPRPAPDDVGSPDANEHHTFNNEMR